MASVAALAMALTAGTAAAQRSAQNVSETAHWTGTWATAPFAPEASDSVPLFADHTLRQVVRTSVAGSAVRLRISNAFGTQPLTVQSVHVALSAGGGATQAGTDHAATFHGQDSITIPPGALALTDPVAMDLPALANVAVSMYLPAQPMGSVTWHGDSAATSYVAAGDQAAAATLSAAQTVDHWFFLAGMDVQAQPASAAIVAFGDSITDGAWVQPDTNHRWPDFLSDRLQAAPQTAKLGVLDEGIGGNRVLYDGTGPSALERLDRDVLAQAGVRFLVVLESINDIGRIFYANDREHAVNAEQLEQGLAQISARAHEHGIKVFGATLTPYQGSGYYTERGEQVRQTVNQWIRTSNTFDGVIDFDQAVRDPAHPARFLPADDHGDHLHPSDAGYKAMADAIDLKLFQ